MAILTSPSPADVLDDNYWHHHVDRTTPSDLWALSSVLWRSANDETSALSLAQIELLRLIGGAASLSLTDGAKPPFQPMISLREKGRSTALEDFEHDDVVALAALAPTAPTPALRARLADVAVTRGQDIGSNQWRSGALAVANYLEVAESHLLSEDGMDVLNDFLRGVRLAWVYCKKDRETHERYWAIARQAITQSLTSDRLGMAFILCREIRKYGGEMAREVAAELDHTGDRLTAAGQHEAASRCFDNAADLWARCGNGGGAKQSRLLQGEALVTHAMAATGPAFARSSWLMDGIEVLRRAGGDRARIDELRRTLADIQQDSLQAFRSRGHSVDLSDVVRDVDATMVGPSFYDCVYQMVAGFSTWPRFDKIRQHILRSANRFPLSGLFPGVHLNHEGAVVARQDALDPANEESIYQAMVRSVHDVDVPFRANAIVVRAVDILFTYHPSFFHVYEIVATCPLVPERHEESIARGLFAGLHSDWLEAAAFLIPQVEPFVRYQFRLHNVLTVVMRDDGIQAEKTLGELLRSEQAEAILGKDFILEMDALLVHPMGYLLRHNWAHGLVDDDHIINAGLLALWLTFWRLVLWPELVRGVVESRPDTPAEDAPNA